MKEEHTYTPPGLYRAWMLNQRFMMNGIEYVIIGSSYKGVKFQNVPKDESPISEYDYTEEQFFSKVTKFDMYSHGK